MHVSYLVLSFVHGMPNQGVSWKKLFIKCQFSNIEHDRCRVECLERVETMWETLQNKFIWERGMGLCNYNSWVVHWLARLTRTLTKSGSIPFQYNIVREGFSKPNMIRSHLRAASKLEALDALMWISWMNILVDKKLIGVMSYWYDKIWGADKLTLVNDMVVWYTCNFL